jgi:curved DNA-binding protein CbpA
VEEPIDAYRVLQVDPAAEAAVLHAAYRALARIYHPDGVSPDARRMAIINRAYGLIGRPDRRERYDADRQRLSPTGPGFAWRAPYDPWSAASGGAAAPGLRQHVAAAGARAGVSGSAAVGGSTILDFGRYAGWSLAQLVRHDPDYLRWLCRQSAGVRYRRQILELLPNEPDLDRRGKSVA